MEEKAYGLLIYIPVVKVQSREYMSRKSPGGERGRKGEEKGKKRETLFL